MWILRLKGLTVEFPTTLDPRLTATLVIPSPCYYGLFFFLAVQQNSHTFSCKRILVNTVTC